MERLVVILYLAASHLQAAVTGRITGALAVMVVLAAVALLLMEDSVLEEREIRHQQAQVKATMVEQATTVAAVTMPLAVVVVQAQ
jgi:hypothetical protein